MSRRRLGQLRIIGGEWRSRLIDFDAGEGADGDVRPTPDRVRQTVFDWLSPMITGATCLDLFAGSGALGLEALSRGAAHSCFLETGAAQLTALRNAAEKLGAGARADIIHAEALNWLRTTRQHFDVVFLDPPYGAGLLEPVLQLLPPLMKPEARVYLEWPAGTPPVLPAGWELLREKKAGQVSYALAAHRAPEDAN